MDEREETLLRKLLRYQSLTYREYPDVFWLLFWNKDANKTQHWKLREGEKVAALKRSIDLITTAISINIHHQNHSRKG